MPIYADVAVPVHVYQTFLYELPEAVRPLVQLGARILVPLGKSLIAGYVVGLHTQLPEELGTKVDEIKVTGALIDEIPICRQEILQITKWVADYYASPWGEVIKAALPPGISPIIEERIRITGDGHARLEALTEDDSSLQKQILKELLHNDAMSRAGLAHLAPETSLNRTLREMEQQGWLVRDKTQGDAQVKTKTRRVVQLQHPPAEESIEKLTEGQRRVLDAFRSTSKLTVPGLSALASVNVSTVMSLAKKGILKITNEAVRRDPFSDSAFTKPADYRLTNQQTSVLERIEASLSTKEYTAFLLHGVTGSGKTEVYIRAMRKTLELGRSAMMLVPEIALTPVFSNRLRSHFGDQVAIFHSSLQRGERFDEWTRVRNGEARIVIGTRSAVFAPIANLGLVVVDEEHESSYRQQDSPYYSGRDTAIVRAQKESATVILGSATPSLESFHNARNGKYEYLQLSERIGARPMAAASIIDMRKVFAEHGKPQVFSDELAEAIEQTHARGEQSIILLNRRGYSSFVLCRSCGETIQCPNCDVTLTYHRAERVMLCHYCNHSEPAPGTCPACGKKYIYYVGEGTEKLEELLKERFPALGIARIDRDTTARRRRFEKILLDFSRGQIDMLVGTQMLAKGHDFPNVTLVGVVSVDAGLALADFRAAERTFQLITQVAGRAGRGDRPGRVLIQTYHPYHYALRHACAQDYEKFYDEEIVYRQNHSYPPFVALASVLVHGSDLGRVRSDALELRRELDKANGDRLCRILGPAPAPLARLKGQHRFQLLIKSRSRRQLRVVADAALKAIAEQGVNLRSINLEIDPISMM
ncbi:MAG TPA: primosomal protein N' [Pyrinomonadaceae bacterium]|nr:primosomal protein N' [Pyrinomonadaceae bacterium]